MRKPILIALAVAVAIAGTWWFSQDRSAGEGSGAALVEVTVPALSGPAEAGKVLFDASCASCHGANAAGVDGSGPPLIHKIYEPSHHGDRAFLLAVMRGVRGHHWAFGDMAPVEGVTERDVARIIAYVRALQRANGIR